MKLSLWGVGNRTQLASLVHGIMGELLMIPWMLMWCKTSSKMVKEFMSFQHIGFQDWVETSVFLPQTCSLTYLYWQVLWFSPACFINPDESCKRR